MPNTALAGDNDAVLVPTTGADGVGDSDGGDGDTSSGFVATAILALGFDTLSGLTTLSVVLTTFIEGGLRPTADWQESFYIIT